MMEVGSGEREVESGKWRVGSGEWELPIPHSPLSNSQFPQTLSLDVGIAIILGSHLTILSPLPFPAQSGTAYTAYYVPPTRRGLV